MADTLASMRLNRSNSGLVSLTEMGQGLSFSIITEWEAQLVRYAEYWKWMDGQVWEAVDKYAVTKKDMQAPLVFPIQMNPLYTAALMHRYTLFGEVPDSGSPLVRPVAIPKIDFADQYDSEDAMIMSGSTPTLKTKPESEGNKESRRNAAEASEVLDLLWYQSDGRLSMYDAGFISQTLGGCVWKCSYEPWNQNLEPGYPIAFRQIEPEFFLPIYSSIDHVNLIGCRLGRMIDAFEAREVFGIDVQGDVPQLYLESWVLSQGQTVLTVTVGGKEPRMKLPGAQNEFYNPSGVMPFNFIPFVYIPHEVVGGFYGVPIIYQLGALLKEMNGRAADIGDAIRNSVERIYILTNTDPAEVQVKDLGGGIRVMSTGKQIPGSAEKRIDVANPPAMPGGTSEFMKFLQHGFWQGAFTPPVAYGEDEGSQRSALTLAFRMWPLTSHIRMERSLWTTALRVMSRMALKMLQVRQGETSTGVLRIEDRHLGHKLQFDWAPMIPRDQESEVGQVILRHQDDQLSTQTSIEKIGDIADVQEELRRIKGDQLNASRMEAASAGATAAAGGGPQFGRGGGSASSPAKKPTAKASSSS